jgi:hypothetical protein
MHAEWEANLLNFLQGVYDQFGWLGVLSLMVLESATGMTSSEVILSLAAWERSSCSCCILLAALCQKGCGSACAPENKKPLAWRIIFAHINKKGITQFTEEAYFRTTRNHLRNS